MAANLSRCETKKAKERLGVGQVEEFNWKEGRWIE